MQITVEEVVEATLELLGLEEKDNKAGQDKVKG